MEQPGLSPIPSRYTFTSASINASDTPLSPKPQQRQDTTESYSDAPSSNKEPCCLLRLFNYVKEQILSFFGWLCSCLVSKPATKEEKVELAALFNTKMEDLIKTIAKRYTGEIINYKSDLLPCLLADVLKIFSLFGKVTNLCKIFEKNDSITQRELNSKKTEFLSIVNTIYDSIDLDKHPIERNYSEDMQRKVEDFSLEKLDFIENGQGTIKAAMIVFGDVDSNILNDFIQFVDDIRAKHQLGSIENLELHSGEQVDQEALMRIVENAMKDPTVQATLSPEMQEICNVMAMGASLEKLARERYDKPIRNDNEAMIVLFDLQKAYKLIADFAKSAPDPALLLQDKTKMQQRKATMQSVKAHMKSSMPSRLSEKDRQEVRKMIKELTEDQMDMFNSISLSMRSRLLTYINEIRKEEKLATFSQLG